MRAKRTLRVLVLLLAVSLLPALAVSAHHGPTVEDVVARAKVLSPYTMDCQPTATEMLCNDHELNQWAVITPASGPMTSLETRAPAFPGDFWVLASNDKAWMADLQNIGCNNNAAVAAFMDKVEAMANMSGSNSLPPEVVGECTMSATLGFDRVSCANAPCYMVSSALEDQSTPTPSPTPTPIPKPTATPTPTPTPTSRPTATATATATAGASASESALGTVTETASGGPSISPEQTVAGITFTPEPSEAAPAPVGVGDDWAGSVPSLGDVSTDAANLAGSALAALLLLLAMGFIGELFNNTLESNYDRILAAWRGSWLGRIGKAFSGLWGGGA